MPETHFPLPTNEAELNKLLFYAYLLGSRIIFHAFDVEGSAADCKDWNLFLIACMSGIVLSSVSPHNGIVNQGILSEAIRL